MKNFFGEAIDWIGGALEDVGKFAGEATEFIAGLPGEISGFADRLALAQREAAAGATERATDFRKKQLLGELGPYLLIGGIGLAVVLLAGK